MKFTTKSLLFALVITGLQFGLSGCVGEVGVDGGYYGGYRGDPWYHDGRWMDGGRWDAPRGTVNIDIHPPGRRR